MDKLSFPVRCTREEYMQFCATCRKGPMWTTALGAVVLALTVILCVIDRGIAQHTLLLFLVGITLLFLSSMILPMMRKGAAGRRYDASDALKDAVMLTLDEQSLYVRSASQEGTVPLCALTAVKESAQVMALEFGKELTVCIPLRTLQEEEQRTLRAILNKKG